MKIFINNYTFELDGKWEEGWRFDSIEMNPNLYFFLPGHLKIDEILNYIMNNHVIYDIKVGTSVYTCKN